MKAIKVTSRDVARIAGHADEVLKATGRSYQAVRDASNKGLLMTEDGQLYVRYGELAPPPKTVAYRLLVLADYIEKAYAGRGAADPVTAAMTSGITKLQSTVPLTERQYARFMLGAAEGATHLDVRHPSVVVAALRAEAARCRS